MKLLFLAASHRPDSLNKQLVQLAVKECNRLGVETDLMDYASLDMPPFNDIARQSGEIPPPALILKEKLEGAEGWVLSSPEYNWSYPGALKNIIDWVSHFRPVPFAGKTALLLSATPSRRGGAVGLTHLRVPLEALGSYVYPEIFTLSEAHSAFQEDGSLILPQTRDTFYPLVERFVLYTKRLSVRD